MTFLGEGDLAGARAVLKAAPKEVEPTTLVAYVANFNDLVWLLDEQQRELLLRLTPSAFDNDRGVWGLCLTQAFALKGEAANVHSHAEEARKAFEEQLRAAPQNGQRHALLGLVLAYLGRKEEAIREGKRGVALDPVSAQHSKRTLQPAPARTDLHPRRRAREGARPVRTAAEDPRITLSPGWLKIDPNFDPLRENPRFQKLVAGGK